MKKAVCFVLAWLMLCAAAVTVFAAEYTAFDIVFEEKAGEKVNDTVIKVFASVDDGALVDRTADFTLEGVEWFRYLPAPEAGKTADDYDYVDEELKIYGILCTDDDVFAPEDYSYFLRISRLYAQEEDTFTRNVKINGVDVEELQGICYNTGSEFYIKTVTNGMGGAAGGEDADADPADADEGDSLGEKCRVCGICPIQPLGICLFIWLAIILIVVILVVLLAVKGKKKRENKS